jgi:primosomal protein N''
LKQLENEIAQLQESNARIARFERELFSSSSQPPSTGDSSPT